MACAMCMAVIFMSATAVVQADQCSSGGECPTNDEPHNLVSLLQTKLRMNVLKDGPSMMKNPSAMLTELEGMVRSGDTPAFDLITTIKSLIEDDIMPGLQTTRDAAAEATRDALRKIQSCNNKSKTEEANIEATYQVSVDSARSLHAACREAEKMLHDHNLTDSDSYCVKLGKFWHGATPLEIPEGHNREQSVKYVKDASLEDMCSHTKVTELDNGCTASEAELEDKKAECSANQRSFESEFCTWKTELELNCRRLNTCHSEAVTAYDSHVNKTEALVEKWNVETAALQKILCYCNVWLSDMDDGDNRSQHNVTQFDVCKDQTYSPGPVDHGTPAGKASCPLTSVECHPGKNCFDQEYSGFADFVAPAIPCMQPEPCAAACPKGCDSWDDAHKTECSDCLTCQRAMDPCLEACLPKDCYDNETILFEPECHECFMCHSVIYACDGKAQEEECEVWGPIGGDMEGGSLELVQNTGTEHMIGKCTDKPMHTIYENEGPNEVRLMGGRGGRRQGGGRHRGGGMSVLGAYAMKGDDDDDEKVAPPLWCEWVPPNIEACKDKQEGSNCSIPGYSPSRVIGSGRCVYEFKDSNYKMYSMSLIGGREGGRQVSGGRKVGGQGSGGRLTEKGREEVLSCEFESK